MRTVLLGLLCTLFLGCGGDWAAVTRHRNARWQTVGRQRAIAGNGAVLSGRWSRHDGRRLSGSKMDAIICRPAHEAECSRVNILLQCQQPKSFPPRSPARRQAAGL